MRRAIPGPGHANGHRPGGILLPDGTEAPPADGGAGAIQMAATEMIRQLCQAPVDFSEQARVAAAEVAELEDAKAGQHTTVAFLELVGRWQQEARSVFELERARQMDEAKAEAAKAAEDAE